MTETSMDDLLGYLSRRLETKFRSEIRKIISEDGVMTFVRRCTSADQLRTAAEWCLRDKIHLFHKIFEEVNDVADLSFLRSSHHKPDAEGRTWLHTAVMHDRKEEIIRFLISEFGLNVETEDDYGYTPLHHYCQKEIYSLEVIKMLLKDQRQLIKQSKDGLTPLEFACSNQDHLSKIQELKIVKMKDLLKCIDDVSSGVMEVEKYSLSKWQMPEKMWLSILQKDDKYLLFYYIKNDDRFVDKYYLDPQVFLNILKKCPENGQGILSYVMDNYFSNTTTDPLLHEIISSLTGIKFQKQTRKRTFYKSVLLLALMTGRFKMISPLLRSSQFEIVSYAMLVCLICTRLAHKNCFPDQVVKNINDVKDDCEDYGIAVMNRTYNRDRSKDKTVITEYINRQQEKFGMKSILELAYEAKCTKYLSLPACQESLTHIWQKGALRSPRLKFWLHSIVHIEFLLLFSYIVVNLLYAKISIGEWICYAYVLGYMVEEVREIIFSIRDDHIRHYYRSASNVIDISGIFFMVIGFILRLSLRVPQLRQTVDIKGFNESRHGFIFTQRLFLCMALILFYMRVLYFASINPVLGPKMTMISTMIIRDLFPLLFIFLIFLISFGVTFQSLLFPNSFYTKEAIIGGNMTFDKKSLVDTIGDIFKRATFTVFDFHHTLNDIENNQNNYVTDLNGRYAVYILLVVFIVIVNVMLMNLLIALFSYTVTKIISESKQSWKSGRYMTIKEYSERTILPPPLNIFEIVFELFRHCGMKTSPCTDRSNIVPVEAHGEDSMPLQSSSPVLEVADEPSMSYYIYQAFAMSGQRYRILKDIHDLEYEKEVHFKTIEDRIQKDNTEMRLAIQTILMTLEKGMVKEGKDSDNTKEINLSKINERITEIQSALATINSRLSGKSERDLSRDRKWQEGSKR